jgi:hypothetical protein
MILFIAPTSAAGNIAAALQSLFQSPFFLLVIETWKVIFRPFALCREKPAATTNSQPCCLVIDLEIIGPLQ